MGVPKKDRFNDNWYGIRKREWYGVILRLTEITPPPTIFLLKIVNLIIRKTAFLRRNANIKCPIFHLL